MGPLVLIIVQVLFLYPADYKDSVDDGSSVKSLTENSDNSYMLVNCVTDET